MGDVEMIGLNRCRPYGRENLETVNLGLRSRCSLQPRLSHGGLSAPGNGEQPASEKYKGERAGCLSPHTCLSRNTGSYNLSNALDELGNPAAIYHKTRPSKICKHQHLRFLRR